MTETMQRTASGKEAALVAFYEQLARDGLTVGDLAALARVGRCHLVQMLNAQRTGRQTWKHVIPLLSNAAVFHLKQCSAWNNFAAKANGTNVTNRTGWEDAP